MFNPVFIGVSSKVSDKRGRYSKGTPSTKELNLKNNPRLGSNNILFWKRIMDTSTRKGLKFSYLINELGILITKRKVYAKLEEL